MGQYVTVAMIHLHVPILPPLGAGHHQTSSVYLLRNEPGVTYSCVAFAGNLNIKPYTGTTVYTVDEESGKLFVPFAATEVFPFAVPGTVVTMTL